MNLQNMLMWTPLPRTNIPAKCMLLVGAFVNCCVVVMKGTVFLLLVKILYSFLSHLLIFQWAWLFPPSPPWLCCMQWLGWNKFCESHRVQVIYTFFLTSVVALKGAVLILYIFSFLFIFLCDHISAIWNDARRSGFWSVGIQYAHGWYVVHSKSINKDEDKDKNIFCFTNNISPKFNDLFIG